MTVLRFHASKNSVPTKPTADIIDVLLYGGSPPYKHVGVVGSQAYEASSRFRLRPSVAVIDFLSIAMAVTAADTFVLRSEAADGWSRNFEIILPLARPAHWRPLRATLEATLRFLSGDAWSFDFRSGGVKPPPESEIRRKIDIVDVSKCDCAALFSGGLDSAIGTLDLLAAGKRPLLVSQAAHKDAKRQSVVAGLLPVRCQHLSANTYPTWRGPDDDSMRTRSFQFIALGALAAQAIAAFRNRLSVELFLSENGLIALNPPLTPRRLGSHSTRTAHPNFLSGISEIIDGAGIPMKIVNPYRYMTKGEMVKPHANDTGFAAFAAETISCGKWKRRNQPCGRCVPCLIRRASLHAAGVPDQSPYQFPQLLTVMDDEDGRDDLIAMLSAIQRTTDFSKWTLQAGPISAIGKERQRYFDVAKRGLSEIAHYLAAQGFHV